VSSFAQTMGFEDEEDIGALREELRLARTLLALQASKIHSLEGAVGSVGQESLESAKRTRRYSSPSPGVSREIR